MDEDDDNGSSLNEPGFHRGDEEMAEAADGEASGDDERRERPDRQERFNRRDRRRAGADRVTSVPRPAAPSVRSDAERMNGGETIPFDALPPAIGRDEEETREAAEAEPKKPRRRARAPRAEQGEDEATPST